MINTHEPSSSVVALRSLLESIAIHVAACRHGTPDQAEEAQKAVDHALSKAWSVLHEHDHTKAECPSPDNYQDPWKQAHTRPTMVYGKVYTAPQCPKFEDGKP